MKICVQVYDVIEAICVNKHMFAQRKPMHAFSNENSNKIAEKCGKFD